MIKALGRLSDGRPILVLGLQQENLARLIGNDDPILLDLAPLLLDGPPGLSLRMRDALIFITVGETQADVAASLRRHRLIT